MSIDLAAADKLLTTTRAVRKRLDLSRPVPRALLEECIEVALQAPTGSNLQNWAFVVVTNAEKRQALADMYRRGGAALSQSGYPPPLADDDPRVAPMARVYDSASYLVDHMHEVPAMVIPCFEGRVESMPMVVAQASQYGSILPAAWSFMLAARARGLGTSLTTVHLFHEAEASTLLGIPPSWTQTALIPVGYYTGDDFKRASRLPAPSVTHWDEWNT